MSEDGSDLLDLANDVMVRSCGSDQWSSRCKQEQAERVYDMAMAIRRIRAAGYDITKRESTGSFEEWLNSQGEQHDESARGDRRSM